VPAVGVEAASLLGASGDEETASYGDYSSATGTHYICAPDNPRNVAESLMVLTVDYELDGITYSSNPKQPPSVAEKYSKAPKGHNVSPECFDASLPPRPESARRASLRLFPSSQ